MDADQEQKLINERLGSYGQYPPNSEEITQSEFLWLWEVKPAHRIKQYRQVRDKNNERATLWFWVFPDFSGVGWRTSYNGRGKDGYTCTYFKFAWCEHDWETIINRMTYRVYVCKKCGYRNEVDSSG
jgi:hypothetical protein